MSFLLRSSFRFSVSSRRSILAIIDDITPATCLRVSLSARLAETNCCKNKLGLHAIKRNQQSVMLHLTQSLRQLFVAEASFFG
jgi:hypothetical protein